MKNAGYQDGNLRNRGGNTENQDKNSSNWFRNKVLRMEMRHTRSGEG